MCKSTIKPRRKKALKVLALPGLEQSKTAVLNSLTSTSGQRTYDHAIREFVAWYCSEPRLAFNRTVVLRYRIHLEQRHVAPATINLRLAAVRRVAYEAADAGLLSPELAAGIRRVKGVRRLGVRLGNWLTPEQGRRLLTPRRPTTLRELRNHAMLAVLLGCGLRRGELLALQLAWIQQREEHWVIADRALPRMQTEAPARSERQDEHRARRRVTQPRGQGGSRLSDPPCATDRYQSRGFRSHSRWNPASLVADSSGGGVQSGARLMLIINLRVRCERSVDADRGHGYYDRAQFVDYVSLLAAEVQLRAGRASIPIEYA
jgi:integrase